MLSVPILVPVDEAFQGGFVALSFSIPVQVSPNSSGHLTNHRLDSLLQLFFQGGQVIVCLFVSIEQGGVPVIPQCLLPCLARLTHVSLVQVVVCPQVENVPESVQDF